MASYLDEKSLDEDLEHASGYQDEKSVNAPRRKTWWRVGAAFILIGLINYFIVTRLYFTLDSNPLDTIRDRYDLPSIAIGVARNGKFDSDAVGIRKRWSTPEVTIDDQWHLGSCTKAMTATLGAVVLKTFFKSWDTTVADVLPKLASNLSSEHRATTLAMLTAHRSGITDEWLGKDANLTLLFLSQLKSPVETRQIIAETLLSRPPNVEPGSQFIYSNTGYMIFGYILETLTGLPWEDLIRIGLFVPLGMTSCGFGVPPESSPTAVENPWPHQTSYFGPIPIPPVRGDNPPAIGPAGSVHCSMADYAKFLKLHVDGYRGKPTRLLRSGDFLRLHMAYPGAGQQYSSGGWNIMRDERVGTVLGHEGSNGLFYANAFVTPDVEAAWMAMTNIAHESAQAALADAIDKMIDGELLGPGIGEESRT